MHVEEVHGRGSFSGRVRLQFDVVRAVLIVLELVVGAEPLSGGAQVIGRCRATRVGATGAEASGRPKSSAGGWILAIGLLLGGSVAAPSGAADETPTTTPLAPTTSTLSAEDRQKRDEAAKNLDAAKADDTEIAKALVHINESTQSTQSKVDDAERRLAGANNTLATATAELDESAGKEAELELRLEDKAIEGFLNEVNEPGVFFSERGMNQSIRQTQLLQYSNQDTSDDLEDLRALREDRRIAREEAAQATADAEALQAELLRELELLEEQREVQLSLKSEAESRIAKWEADLSAYAAEDEAIQRVIADSAATPVATAQPRSPSSLGYQWPVVGRQSSPFGYRVHPIYGTRKLHSGLDVAAPAGTPIAATAQGTVIFAGRRGGYGNTVIVDHGGGLTSLYAHMSKIGVSTGTTVKRGDYLGGVGTTGSSTGNHLHFEIRSGGTPVNPAPYLP